MGVEGERRIVVNIEEASGVRGITTSGSILPAMKAMGVGRVAIGTPYEPRIDAKLREFLETQGMEVVSISGLGLKDDWEIGTAGPYTAYQLARQVDSPQAEAVFISDTGFQMIEVAEIAERDLGKPVVSASMVTMWNALRTAGIRESLPGLGTLFTVHSGVRG
jgi:arylmalonate decarboxylase